MCQKVRMKQLANHILYIPTIYFLVQSRHNPSCPNILGDTKWATSRENVSLEIFEQVRFKPACSATEGWSAHLSFAYGIRHIFAWSGPNNTISAFVANFHWQIITIITTDTGCWPFYCLRAISVGIFAWPRSRVKFCSIRLGKKEDAYVDQHKLISTNWSFPFTMR